MTYTVRIDAIKTAFYNAHRALWDQKNPDGCLLRGVKTTELQERWWLEEHGVLVYGDSFKTWDYADFPSEEYLSYFILKWG